MSISRRRAMATLCAMPLLGASVGANATRPPTIAAASRLRHLLPGLAKSFIKRGHPAPRFVFGSSGNLYRQLHQGAPFGVFLSANAEFADRLVDAGKTAAASRSYATGRLALVVSRSARAGAAPLTLAAWVDTIRAGHGKVAIANPKHAPYGVAAREVLQALDLWGPLKGRLIVGENAAQAMQFALAGGVQAALLPLSLALLKRLKGRTQHVVLSQDLFTVLDHKMALMHGATEAERAFFDFMASPPAMMALRAGGFAAPLPS